MKDFVILAVPVLPVASCLEQPVVVPVSSVLLLHCRQASSRTGAAPCASTDNVVLLHVLLFLCSARSNLSSLVSTVTHGYCTTSPVTWFGGVSLTPAFGNRAVG